MTEFVIKLADERGRVMEQNHAAATAEELRARFTQAGYYVYSVKAKSLLGASKKKVKLETFLIFNQQFLTLIKAGLPILGSLELLARRQKLPHFRAQLEDVAARVKTGESISQAFEAQGGFPGEFHAAATIQNLCGAFMAAAENKQWAVIPEYGGKHGHPFLAGRELIEAFLQAPAASSAREVEHRNQPRIAYLAVDDPFIALNIDTPEDYAALLAHSQRPS